MKNRQIVFSSIFFTFLTLTLPLSGVPMMAEPSTRAPRRTTNRVTSDSSSTVARGRESDASENIDNPDSAPNFSGKASISRPSGSTSSSSASSSSTQQRGASTTTVNFQGTKLAQVPTQKIFTSAEETVRWNLPEAPTSLIQRVGTSDTQESVPHRIAVLHHDPSALDELNKVDSDEDFGEQIVFKPPFPPETSAPSVAALDASEIKTQEPSVR